MKEEILTNNPPRENTAERKSVAFKTLGCRLNQYETDALASSFDKAGYRIVEFEDQADIYIINTCTVTNQSDRKSRRLMKQAIKRDEKEDSLVIMTGCSVNNHLEHYHKHQG